MTESTRTRMKPVAFLAIAVALSLAQGCASKGTPPAKPAVVSPEVAHAQKVAAARKELQRLASSDLGNSRAFGIDLVKEMSEQLDEYIALTRSGGQSAEYDKSVTEYSARLEELKVEKVKLDAERARIAAAVENEIQRNKARFDSGELVCSNPNTTIGRFDRVRAYTGDWMVFYCGAVPASRK